MAEEQQNVQSEQEQETQPTTISIRDLYNLLAVLDYSVQKGNITFDNWDLMAQTISLRNKLYKFLEENMEDFEKIRRGEETSTQAQDEQNETKTTTKDSGSKSTSKGKGSGKSTKSKGSSK